MLNEELGCLGFYGFGGGYAISKSGDRIGEIFCGKCPSKVECWERHKARCAEIFPAASAEFELMAKTMEGPELVEAWMDRYNTPDPYMSVLNGNLQDGIEVGAGRVPHTRRSVDEEVTLTHKDIKAIPEKT